ncbi:2'-5' RNA ligase family protein [Mycolicibacter kumamotonensis]|uniref:2'-5' RNA ligase n=1 Tax=Mycolicibacter kumamotonensis TaxID=354243 RepID=A0A1B8SLC1_9MYCO|nr:2'-5' RNA ligase family protein [Mycolicibacter kumamotonensis]OBY33539.1 hypothetical protein ACT18_01005 [Mycolicibacter kumamotonensis]
MSQDLYGSTSAWVHPAYQLITADAEQAKQTGGMCALYPRRDFAEALVVEGGEPVEDMHVTLAYFGEDVSDLPADTVARAVASVADQYTHAIEARVMGHAIFNPDGGPTGKFDPCIVYLIGDSQEIGPLRQQIVEACGSVLPNMHKQHEPFIPHCTAAYAIQKLTYTGPIVFDRISIDWAGQHMDFPLLDDNI